MLQLQESKTKLDIFKITLRSQIITDENGSIIRSFVISYYESKFECPTITFTQASSTYKLTTSKRDNPEVIFAPELNFDPLTEFTNGEFVIEYLLNQNSLVAKNPEIRCDIIDAKNALKLRESDVHYFYKPDQLSFNKDVKYIDNDLEWSCESYQMIFKIPDDYEIPVNLNFKFKEYCFGNRWTLEWNGTKWFEYNIHGRRSSKVMRKINIRTQKDSYGAAGYCVGVKNDDWNRRHIPASDSGLAYSLFEDCKNNGKFESKIMFNDGSIASCSDYELVIGYSNVLHGAKFDGYDLVSVSALYRNYSSNTLNIKDINCIVLELTQPNEYESNKLTFSLGDVHHDSVYNRGVLDISGVNDTIEVVSGVYSKRSIDIENSRDIILYLHKDYVDPIEEVNWDPTANPFEYIIKQQFYEVYPNPNAATTLNTDFNITSSKIITADNITAMRSDLNIVTNNLDVVSYDVKDIKVKVDVLNSEMAETKKVTKHLQEDIDHVRVVSNVALAFGVIGTVGSAASIGMQLASNGISFAVKGGTSMLTKCHAEPAEYEMNTVSTTLFQSLPISRTRALSTDITPFLTWCNSDYKEIPSKEFEDEADDRKTTAASVYTTIDISNIFRDSLKPAFRLLANRVNEISSDVENIDLSDQLTTLENRFNDKLKQYVNQDELVRDDEVDIFPRVDNEHSALIFESEDNMVS